jgi:hypothetical protein
VEEHRILLTPGFRRELAAVDAIDHREADAVEQSIHMLRARGAGLGFPWSSHVRASPVAGLRELRPRRGRSRTRVLYRRIADGFELLALAPEAQADRRGFAAALARAAERASETDGSSTT